MAFSRQPAPQSGGSAAVVGVLRSRGISSGRWHRFVRHGHPWPLYDDHRRKPASRSSIERSNRRVDRHTCKPYPSALMRLPGAKGFAAARHNLTRGSIQRSMTTSGVESYDAYDDANIFAASAEDVNERSEGGIVCSSSRLTNS